MKAYRSQYTIGVAAQVLVIISGITPNSAASSTPSEMADFSLQDLLSLSIEDSDETSGSISPWQLSFSYKQLRLDGYKAGKNNVSIDDVLFSPGEIRTDQNFPVVPTEITQEVLMMSIDYALCTESNINISLPYIKQGTDHVSSVANYDNFLIISDGLGDIATNYSRILKRWEKEQITWSIGLSFPTGSIDEQGDTPREPGDQQLPYTMQLGSGTWDIPFGIGYQKHTPARTWNVSLLAKIRTGKNDRNYRLGNRLTFTASTQWNTEYILKPLVKLQYINWGRIIGQDDEIIVPNPAFPYPAAITNPRYYGGEKLKAIIGLEFSIMSQLLKIEVGKPLYQNLNGIQNDEELHFSLNWDL